MAVEAELLQIAWGRWERERRLSAGCPVTGRRWRRTRAAAATIISARVREAPELAEVGPRRQRLEPQGRGSDDGLSVDAVPADALAEDEGRGGVRRPAVLEADSRCKLVDQYGNGYVPDGY